MVVPGCRVIGACILFVPRGAEHDEPEPDGWEALDELPSDLRLHRLDGCAASTLDLRRASILVKNWTGIDLRCPMLKEADDEVSHDSWALMKVADGYILRPGNEFLHYFRLTSDGEHRLMAVSYRHLPRDGLVAVRGRREETVEVHQLGRKGAHAGAPLWARSIDNRAGLVMPRRSPASRRTERLTRRCGS